MSPSASAAVAVRRILVKRPWIYWSIVAFAALGAAATMLDRVDRVDAERESWGAAQTVLVATADHEPGERLTVETRQVARAILPAGAVTELAEIDGAVARQRIGAGEIINAVDLATGDGPQAMTPPDWLAVPVVESPRSAAGLGDRVLVASDGFVISTDAIVVGGHDDVTLVAVPADEAPGVAAADGVGAVTLLLRP